MKYNSVLGVDIGGTHISVCMLNLSTGLPEKDSFVRSKIDPGGTAEEVIDAWCEAIESCLAQYPKLKEMRIGIAMPGPFDYEKGISYIKGLHKYESLYGLNVKQLMAHRLSLPSDNIRMINDASAYLLGEVMGGAGKGYTKAAGITLGTGLGSAIFRKGNIDEGDLYCTPFKDASAEDYLCTRWFIKAYSAVSGKAIKGVKDLVPLLDNDPLVKNVFSAFSDHLAEVLLMKYPPEVQDVVIIGGNIAKTWKHFIPATLEYFKRKGVVMNLQPALLGENAAITGAAFLWRE